MAPDRNARHGTDGQYFTVFPKGLLFIQLRLETSS